MNLSYDMPASEALAEISEIKRAAGERQLAGLLFSLAVRVRRMERALDEIVENAREEARIAEGRS